MLLANF